MSLDMTPGEFAAFCDDLWARAERGELGPDTGIPYDGPLPEVPPADDYDYAVAEDRETQWREGR